MRKGFLIKLPFSHESFVTTKTSSNPLTTLVIVKRKRYCSSVNVFRPSHFTQGVLLCEVRWGDNRIWRMIHDPMVCLVTSLLSTPSVRPPLSHLSLTLRYVLIYLIS